MIAGLKVICIKDVRTYFKNFYGVGFRTIDVLLQTIIFAYILSQVVPPGVVGSLTYVQYFALGSLVISVFWASYSIGQDVYWDRENGYLNYLMSLPISRTEIVVGRSTGGAIRAIFNALPLYGLAFFLVPTTIINILQSLGLLFIFSLGLCGLGITIAFLVREETKVRLLNTFLSLALIRSSTAMYPAVAMPVWLQVGTKLNPVTYASDSIRAVTVNQPGLVLSLNDVSIVLIFATLSGLAGSWLFSKTIEGGPAE